MSSAHANNFIDPDRVRPLNTPATRARHPFLREDYESTLGGLGSRESTLLGSSSDHLLGGNRSGGVGFGGSSTSSRALPPRAPPRAPPRPPPESRAVEFPPGTATATGTAATGFSGGFSGLEPGDRHLSVARTPSPFDDTESGVSGTRASSALAPATLDGTAASNQGSESDISQESKKSIFTQFTSRWRNSIIFGMVFAIVVGLIIGLSVGLTKAANDRGNTKVLVRSRPYYPTPKGGWVPGWTDAYRQAAEIVGKMELTEKVNLTTGTGWSMGPCVGNTGSTKEVPHLCLQDGPAGIRFADDITAFPAGVTVAATWSKYLMYSRAAAIGAEARAKGVNILLGPCMGPLGRFPLGGRNWEGFGSDPYLQGVASAITVQGIQDQGVIATAKHYIGNEQERFRQVPEAHIQGWPNVTETLSSNIGDRTLHEMYLWPFAESVHAGVGAIMCSYNQVNNSYACQNSYLLNGVLKHELGFQGFVMSDWLAHHSGVGAALAGMDMSMPGDKKSFIDGDTYWGSYLTEAVVNGTVPIERVDDMALRIVATWVKMGQNTNFPETSFSSWTKLKDGLIYQGTFSGPVDQVNDFVDVRGNHSIVAQSVAAEGIVLLKNFNDTALPMNPFKLPRAIMIFGSDAGPNPYGPNGCIDRGCNNGTLGQGWGSGSVDYTYQITPLESIQARLLSSPGGKRPIVDYMIDDYNLGRAGAMAEVPGAKCFVFVSAAAGEGYLQSEGNLGDRNDLHLWHNGDALIKTVAAKCNDTVVVVHSVGAVVMEEWIDNPNVTAVLMAHLPASESGSSLVNILWGDVSPSGHLPYTIGKSLEDYGPQGDILREPNARIPQDDFVEGLDIDYRYFDTNGIEPRFEFGYGLSYTSFEYGNLTIQRVIQGNLTADLPPAPDKLPVPELKTIVPNPESVVFPPNFNRLRNYHYPYLTRQQAANVGTTNATEYPYPEGWDTEPQKSIPGGGGEGGHPALYDVVFHVDVDIKNTGKVAGKTVAQLYVTFPTGIKVYTPVRQLRGFEKVGLGPGESTTVGFDIRRKDISVWDEVGDRGWYIPHTPGRRTGQGFVIWVGQSSRRGGVDGTTS